MHNDYLNKFLRILDKEVNNQYRSPEISEVLEVKMGEDTESEEHGNEELKADLEELIHSIPKESDAIEYSRIAKAIYSSGYLEFSSFFVKVRNILEDLISNTEDWDADRKVRLQLLQKIINNADLSLVQKNELYISLKKELETKNDELKRDAERLEQQLKDAFSSLERLKEEYKKSEKQVTDKIQSMYGEIIGIIGIFSAFVFVMFGGFDSLAKILENLGDKNISLSRTVFIACILMGFIFTVSYSLLLWTAKISGKILVDKSCDCSIKCNNLWHIFLRHRFYLAVIIVCLVGIVISAAMIIC